MRPGLKTLFSGRADLALRNSILEPRYFHALYSDVDYALVFPELNSEIIERALRFSRILKCVYPFAGEPEIYTAAEWTELGKLKSEVWEFYIRARMLRKWMWQKKAAKKLSWFGRRKHERFLDVARERMRMSKDVEVNAQSLAKVLNGYLHENLQVPAMAELPDYYHSYFQTDLSVLGLSPSDRALWALLFPFKDRAKITNEKLLDVGYTLTRIEVLEVTGSSRAFPGQDWVEEYLGELERSLEDG